MDFSTVQPNTQVTAPPQTVNGAAAANGAPTTANQISSDFQTFLTLLTTQISNQNPLDPMKAEEFAVQLATFSSVEQQVQTNDLLTKIAGNASGDDFLAMTGWIGRDVRAQMPVAYEGLPVTVHPDRPVTGSRHNLVVSDATGAVVDRVGIDGTGSPVTWSGRGPAGRGVPHGVYTFSVESLEGSEVVATEPVSTYGRVDEIRSSPNGPILALRGGIELQAADVTAVRAAPV